VIETQRLLLRKPTVADVEDPPAFLADPRVMDFLGGVEDSRGVVRQWVDGWETYPAGKLIVEAAGERIGRVGFNFYDPERWVRSSSPDAQPELTWALAHEHWGKGYATEAAVAVRDWFGRSGVISLIARRDDRVATLRSARGLDSPAVIETERLLLRKVRSKPTRLYALER